MRTRTEGRYLCPLNPVGYIVTTRVSRDHRLGRLLAVKNYIGCRWNGREIDTVLSGGWLNLDWTLSDVQGAICALGHGQLPLDGEMVKDGLVDRRTEEFVWTYVEGPRDKRFMEAQDRRYLQHLAENYPIGFLLELTPHDKLRDEDIQEGVEEAGLPSKMWRMVGEFLGLDMSLRYHRDLAREFSDEVERIRNPRSRPAPPPVPSHRSGGGGGGGSGGSASASRAVLSASLREIPADEMGRAMRSARKLGAGSFGEVHLATLRDGVQYAVKSIRIDAGDEATRADFYNEAQVMAKLNHPLMVHLYAYCKTDPEKFYLVMEYMALGSLFKLLHSREELSVGTRLRLFLNVAQALAVLHDHGIVHRDLKSENILLKMEDGVQCAKIGDFGLAKAKAVGSKARGYQVGTAGWTAPEIFLEEPASAKSDVYSLGVVLWEMLTRLYPLEGKAPGIVGHLVMAGRVEDMKKVPRDAPEALVNMMLACLMIDADKRPTAKEIFTSLSSAASSRREASGGGGGGGAGYDAHTPGPKTAIMMGMAAAVARVESHVVGIEAMQIAGALGKTGSDSAAPRR